jgi:protein-S-isoprenylcysteine O-methyltransferase Ste14
VLVTHEVFSFSRNPMYLGMLLMLVGIAMATGGMAFYGESYAAYARRVRRWL